MRKLLVLWGLILFSVTPIVAQQQPIKARIAGLESHAEYMSLLEQDAVLQMREDSIASAMIRVRQQLREDPENRPQYSQQILQCENEIFELRMAKGRVIDRINTIEQEWVLANLNAEIARQQQDPAGQELPDSLKCRNLIDNTPFRQHLTRQDYIALRRAQRDEMQAVEMVNRYLNNYLSLTELGATYAVVATEQEALAVLDSMTMIERRNAHVVDSLSAVWNQIFDNKSYAYDYLMEALRKEDQLDRQQERLSATMREIGTLQGETVSDQLVDYFLRKQALVAYELDVAQALQFDSACDSLRGVASQLTAIDYKLPKVTVEERTFIEYDSLRFSSKPVYTATNPIPEVRIYQRGTIYRILLGTFSTKRPVSIFRGTSPLSYQQTEDQKWRYFAGGFATLEEAEAAQATLKKRGFTRPEVVVWMDGIYRNLAEEPLPSAADSGYRIEFEFDDALPEQVRTTIAQGEYGVEISRVGSNRYIIGTFAERADAEKVVEAIRAEMGSIDLSIVQIGQ